MPSAHSSQQGLFGGEGVPRGATARVPVLLPLPFDGAFDYRADPGMLAPVPGSFVDVPLGPRRVVGVVWDDAGDGAVGDKRLRSLGPVLDIPPMSVPMRRFVKWLAAYSLNPLGTCLKLAIVAANGAPRHIKVGYRLAPSSGDLPLRLTPGRVKVLDLMKGAGGLAVNEIAERAGVSMAVVRGVVDLGLLVPESLNPDHLPRPDPDYAAPALSQAQGAAAEVMAADVKAHRFAVNLLDGVTGSGKTETYCEAIAVALRTGRQALVLLPEIALTTGLLERFAARFGVAPTLWHSALGSGLRRRVWRWAAVGEASLVIGARSALFLPFPSLGLIVVDEEHDQAFKQVDGVAYNGRDMAVLRAKLEGCPVILASATPSLETLANVEAGRYRQLILPDRHGGAKPPRVEVLDLRRTPPDKGRFLSPPLLAALADAYGRGEQSLLFLNRRGYAPLTLCRHCGTRIECPNCSAWLVEHRHAQRLVCHHCGHGIPLPLSCPTCGIADGLTACGPGVERIDEEVAEVLPQLRRLVMASDTLHGPAAIEAAFAQVERREVDVVIGTQIVAKGHHFPYLTVVGVVDADLGLDGGDLRAGERTFQLMTQVAGRAGRGALPGRALLQSWSPDNDVIQAIARGDRAGFLAAEAAARRRYGLPPYGRLVALILSGPDQGEVMTAGRMMARTAPRSNHLHVLGPAPAPLNLLRGRYRVRLLVRAAREVNVQAALKPWLIGLELPNAVRLQVDVDPYNFL